MTKSQDKRSLSAWRARMHEIIFEADTPAGKAFDVLLILAILLSVLVVMLESVEPVHQQYGELLLMLEWMFTILFTAEYLLRLLTVRRPLLYARSFFGIVDLLATIPTWISLVLPGAHVLLVIRLLRLLRIFRVLKLTAYLGEAHVIARALRASRRKIFVFLFTVVTLAMIIGTMLYVIEGSKGGFTSIPTGVYWAIVTLTTVGYGDISPVTPLGKTLASILMILGYGIIAVPTGIVTVEMDRVNRKPISTQSCPNCSAEGHDHDAIHCKTCGSML